MQPNERVMMAKGLEIITLKCSSACEKSEAELSLSYCTVLIVALLLFQGVAGRRRYSSTCTIRGGSRTRIRDLSGCRHGNRSQVWAHPSDTIAA